MEDLKYRVVYEYEFRRGTSAAQTARRINDVYGSDFGKENIFYFGSNVFVLEISTYRASLVDGWRQKFIMKNCYCGNCVPSQTTSELAAGCGINDKTF
ncbi:jg21061 [Pararge aegeria aegeria]|uniref:Jg21061 protein n=1 Tax=Pararge aegeria aegeria TaxID=348720 RepID=A0A8S4RS10_9NEOP|nr:jg21061 [Pararge aegeria aegeria]